MDSELQAVLDTFFRTYNAGDERAHQALWGSEMVYFGSTLRTTVQGAGSLQGVWKAIRDGVGIRRITPLQWFGDAPRLAGLVRFEGMGGEPRVSAVMVFGFNAALLIENLSVHWDPGAFLSAKEYPGRTIAVRESPTDKDPRVRAALEAYFRTFNASDEAGHAKVLHPDLSFFGSLSGVQSEGIASGLGIVRAAQQSLGITRLTPKRTFGDWPEVSVLLELSRADGRGTSEAMYVFRFDENGLIRRLETLWNPLPFLKAIGGLP